MPNDTSFVSFRQPRYLTRARPEALRPAIADGLPFRGNQEKQGPRPGSSPWFQVGTLASRRRLVSDGDHTAMIRLATQHGCNKSKFSARHGCYEKKFRARHCGVAAIFARLRCDHAMA